MARKARTRERWPVRAETARLEAIAAAGHIGELTDLVMVALQCGDLAQAAKLLAKIHRLSRYQIDTLNNAKSGDGPTERG